MTNATKAAIIVFINAGLALAGAFGVDLTDAQKGAVDLFVNAALGLWIALTYRDSHKRLPDDTIAVVTANADGVDATPFFQEADYDAEGNLKNE